MTPDDLIARAALKPGMRVLVPAVGDGQIAYAAARARCTVHVLDIERAAVAWFRPPHAPPGTSGQVAEFLTFDPAVMKAHREAYDRVIFILPRRANAEAWTAHARQFLAPGGMVVAPP